MNTHFLHSVLIGTAIFAAALIVLSMVRKAPTRKRRREPLIDAEQTEMDALQGEGTVNYQAFTDDTQPDLPFAQPLAATAAQQANHLIAEASQPTIFTLYVMAREPYQFTGYELLQVLLSSGFRFGKMNIFHRYPTMNTPSDPLFSLASATEPGTFDINDMGAYACKGLCLFARLEPQASRAHHAEVVRLMIETAQQLAAELEGEVHDHRHQLWSNELASHYLKQFSLQPFVEPEVFV